MLVVEDEPSVREFIRTVLTTHSYRVLEASDGIDALNVWSRHPGQVNLLLTDMVMPKGITGRGLADRLHSECPGLKVICASGYGTETIGAEWLKSPDVGFLPKPFTADAILRAVSNCVAPVASPLDAPPLLSP